jgi:hypothetical protein
MKVIPTLAPLTASDGRHVTTFPDETSIQFFVALFISIVSDPIYDPIYVSIYVFSGDKHLLTLGGQYQGIRIVTPAQATLLIGG